MKFIKTHLNIELTPSKHFCGGNWHRSPKTCYTRSHKGFFFIIIYLQFLDGLKVSNNERRCSRDASSRFRPNMASRALCWHFRLFVFSVSAGDLHIHKSISLVSKADSGNFLKTRKVSVLLDDGGNLGIHCRMNKFLFIAGRSYPITPR